jgi:hypothetical protein
VPGDFERLDWSSREVNRAEIGGRETPLPDHLQSPALALPDADVAAGLFVFEQALAMLRERFPAVPITIVYLPSPLTSYRITSPEVSIQVGEPGATDRFPREALVRRSEQICGSVAGAAQRSSAAFVDARIALWPVSLREEIHGPKDWKHFNRRGQEALVEAILPALADGATRRNACLSLADHFAAGS